MRRIVSLWLPRFSIERRQTAPEGGPFTLFCRDASRKILFAVNKAAEKAGLCPGMPLSQARALCPLLKSERHAPEADLAELSRLAGWSESVTPWVALEGPPRLGGGGALWLDITGCSHLCGGERRLLQRLLSAVDRLGYEACLGLAATPGAAWALARYGCDTRQRFRIIAKGEERQALAALPVAALRLMPEKVELLTH